MSKSRLLKVMRVIKLLALTVAIKNYSVSLVDFQLDDGAV